MDQEIFDKLTLMDAKLDILILRTAPKQTSSQFGSTVVSAPVKSYAAMLAKYGTPEAFAIAVKEREKGWPESIESIATGGWDERQEVIDFKADYPELFVR